MNLELATTPHTGVLDVPAGWRQGKGAYGGLVVASMMRAAEQAIADPARTIRSVTAEIPAAVEAGRADLAVEILRAGKSVTTARVALVQRGETRGHAVVIAAAGRGSTAWNGLAPPAAPPWSSVEPMPSGPIVPEFAEHFEYRVVTGIPVSGAAPECIGWIKPREPGARRDAAFIAAVIDAWWPGALVHVRELRPMATIAFTLEIVSDISDLGDEPLLYRSVSPVCADGYAFETRELWRADGRLVARNHQTFVIIK